MLYGNQSAGSCGRFKFHTKRDTTHLWRLDHNQARRDRGRERVFMRSAAIIAMFTLCTAGTCETSTTVQVIVALQAPLGSACLIKIAENGGGSVTVRQTTDKLLHLSTNLSPSSEKPTFANIRQSVDIQGSAILEIETVWWNAPPLDLINKTAQREKSLMNDLLKGCASPERTSAAAIKCVLHHGRAPQQACE